jgi:hypothetical protein
MKVLILIALLYFLSTRMLTFLLLFSSIFLGYRIHAKVQLLGAIPAHTYCIEVFSLDKNAKLSSVFSIY